MIHYSYISHLGGLWRMSAKSYDKMRADMKQKVVIDLNAYGRQIGIVEEFEGIKDYVENEGKELWAPGEEPDVYGIVNYDYTKGDKS